jgi:succinylglutamic semialdehyde dehydrogenase
MGLAPRGDYIDGRFIPVTRADGELRAPDPGDLDATPSRFPFTLSSVDEAVAARRAWRGWLRRLTPEVRSAAATADALSKREEEPARAIVAEMGKLREVAEVRSAL